MALVTVTEIAALLGISPTPLQEQQLDLYRTMAIGEIEGWLGRPISPQTYTDEEVFPDASGNIYVNMTPVIEVTEMRLDDAPVETDTYQVTPWGVKGFYRDYRFSQTVWSDWYTLGLTVTIDYVAGLETPDAVNSLIANGVANKFRNANAANSLSVAGHTDVKAIKVEDYSIEYKTTNTNASLYAARTSPLLIFGNVADFAPIAGFKKRAFG